MDPSRLDVTSAPTEGGMTLCTVHLITSVNLENHSRTLWAVARVLGEELGRLYVIGIARVISLLVLADHLMAVGTGPIVAHAALPRRAQKPATIRCGTCANKLALFVFHLPTVNAIYKLILIPLQMLNNPKRGC